MSFKVDTTQLALFSGVFGAWEVSCTNAQTYASTRLGVSDMSGGLINGLFPIQREAERLVPDAVSKLAPLMEGCKNGLDAAGKLYDSTDAASAERLDRTYPPAPGAPDPVSVPGAGRLGGLTLIQPGNPDGRLTLPKAPDEFEDPNKLINSISDALSISNWTSEVLDELVGINPLDEVSKLVAGDWEEVAKVGDAYNCLSWFCRDLSSILGNDIEALVQSWEGNAADEAYQYFTTLSGDLRKFADSFGQLRDQYTIVSKGVWEFGQAAKDVIQGLLDSAEWAGILAAAGAATAETGVGPVVLWSVAALECWNIVYKWDELTKLIAAVQNLIRVTDGSIRKALGDTGNFHVPPLPAASYHHPGVK